MTVKDFKCKVQIYYIIKVVNYIVRIEVQKSHKIKSTLDFLIIQS